VLKFGQLVADAKARLGSLFREGDHPSS
jgi:hypothetical protein